MQDTVIVCGLGRCGTSLVMKMLAAGGMPFLAESTASYEHSMCQIPRAFDEVESAARGKAVKILDPQRWTWPEKINARFVWIDRNYHQQALSQVKFLRYMFGMDIPKGAVAGIERSLPPDASLAIQTISRGKSVLRLDFEHIIRNPLEVALILGCEFDGLNVQSMAGCVIPRSSMCAPDLAIEIAAMEEEDRRAGALQRDR